MKLGGELGSNWMDAGWHRVVTTGMDCKYTPKGTQVFNVDIADIDDGKVGVFTSYITEKAFRFLARFIADAGIPDNVRETMDTDDPETMEPLLDRQLWVLVDWEKGNSGKWFRKVVKHAPDSDTMPNGGPKYLTCPDDGIRSAPTPGAPPADDGGDDLY